MGRSHTTYSHRARRNNFWRRTMAGILALIALGAVSAASASDRSWTEFLVAQKAIEPPQGFIGVCDRYAWACAAKVRASTTVVDDRGIMALAQRVNRSVNFRYPQITDQAQFNREEHWTLPTRRGGDCEDFALEKKRQLLAAGVPADRLLIATAFLRDRTRHAVLVVRTSKGDMVLDNLTNRILPWEKTGLTFLRMQNPNKPATWDAVFAGGMIPVPRG
ncbi:MAG: transglutaminase-like cysteine peptidase [Pseudomonadota bacterium]